MASGSPSWARTAGTVLLVVVLIAAGVAIGAELWPRAITIERRVVSPIREAGTRARFPETLPDLVEATCPAIVEVLQTSPPPAGPASRRLGRDGILVSDDGLLVTSARGLPDTGLKARLDDGRVVDAAVRAIDRVGGLALLKIEGSGYSTLAFADGDYPRLGTPGFVAAVPPQQGCMVQGATLSSDFVSERSAGRTAVRLRPAPDPAVEGAPFLDAAGQVAGLALPQPRGGALDPSVFLPGDLAAKIVSEMTRAGGPLARPFGMMAEDLTPVLAARLGTDRRGGAMVAIVAPGSAADRAGLRAGDVILSAGGAPVSGATELARTLGGGGPVAITFARGSEAMAATLGR